MPVHIEERGGKHCVVEPGGDVVPSGCYDDRGDALSRLRAINANKGAVDMADSTDNNVAVTSAAVSSDDVILSTSVDGVDALVIETVEGDEKEKGLGGFIVEPTSFEELDEIRAAAKEDMGIQRVVADFMGLVANVMSFPSEKGKAEDIRELVAEMENRLEVEETPFDGASKEDVDALESDTAEMKSNGLFTVWKDEATGEYMWIGVYSNKFRDDDSPAEILAEEAHLRFIGRVEKGELAYPDLYVWHIPVSIGKATLLAYDSAGFSIASGLIKKEFAIALMSSSEDWAMSHAMPVEAIRRDESDRTVITDYVSNEISVLPRWAAANKMTDFYILDEEEAKMAIIPDEKRQQVAHLLGDELTEKLEAGLTARSNKAVAAGVEFKEEEAQPEETVEEVEAEIVEEETEVTMLEEETGEEELTEETDGVAEESAEETGAGAAEEKTSASEPMLLRSEVAEALAFVVETVTAQTTQLAKSIEALSVRMEAVKDGGHADEEETKESELPPGTPTDSLTAILAGRLAATGSVIGNPIASVHGNNALAKEGPEETPEGVKEGESGLFFNSWNR